MRPKWILERVNSETGLALKDDPALAWVTLLGEVSLFNLIDDPDPEHVLPSHYAQALRSCSGNEVPRAPAGGSGKRWRRPIIRKWPRPLRGKVRVPIAGCSHWRREPEFVAAQAPRLST